MSHLDIGALMTDCEQLGRCLCWRAQEFQFFQLPRSSLSWWWRAIAWNSPRCAFLDGVFGVSCRILSFFQISRKTSEKMLPICLFDWEFNLITEIWLSSWEFLVFDGNIYYLTATLTIWLQSSLFDCNVYYLTATFTIWLQSLLFDCNVYYLTETFTIWLESRLNHWEIVWKGLGRHFQQNKQKKRKNEKQREKREKRSIQRDVVGKKDDLF